MSKKFGFLKSGLMGSSTLPMGAAGTVSVFTPVYHHEHAADGSCCGHHHPQHDESCDHDHVHDESCGHKHGK